MDYILHLKNPTFAYKGATVVFRTSDYENMFLEVGISVLHREDVYNKKTGVKLATEALNLCKPGRYAYFELDTVCNFLNKESPDETFPAQDLTVTYLIAYLFAKKDKSILSLLADIIVCHILDSKYTSKEPQKTKVRLRPTYILTQDLRIGRIHKSGEMAVYDPDVNGLNYYWLHTGELIPRELQPDQNLDVFKRLSW